MGVELHDLVRREARRFVDQTIIYTARDLDNSFLVNQPRSPQGIRTYQKTLTGILEYYPLRLSPNITKLLTELGLTDRLALTITGTGDKPMTFHPDPRYPKLAETIPSQSYLVALQDDRESPTTSFWMVVNPGELNVTSGCCLDSVRGGSLYFEGLNAELQDPTALLPAVLAKDLADSLRRITGVYIAPPER